MISILIAPDAGNMDSVQLNLMNTTFHICIENSNGVEWKEPVISFLRYIHEEFSRFRKNNELWQLNEAPRNKTVRVSPILYDMLKKAEEYRKKLGEDSPPICSSPWKNTGTTAPFLF